MRPDGAVTSRHSFARPAGSRSSTTSPPPWLTSTSTNQDRSEPHPKLRGIYEGREDQSTVPYRDCGK